MNRNIFNSQFVTWPCCCALNITEADSDMMMRKHGNVESKVIVYIYPVKANGSRAADYGGDQKK